MISNESLIYNKLCELHPNGLGSITSLSRNTTGKRDFIISDAKAFNYDLVHNCSSAYVEEKKEKTPDALFLHDNSLYFIEFKEGNSDKHDIRLKIYEGLTSLFHLVSKNIPAIGRTNFMDLNINYAVICRHKGNNGNQNSFLNTLNDTSKRYSLKNIEGFLVKKTRVIEDGQLALELLHKISDGAIQNITIFEYLGTTQSFSKNT
ncbi:hypothetical protein [Pectobacterium punjabense]|uniref:hypothetical protein n=1 Tax=Pectobacterium punjabense TaxID=2108399 RepID=UPI002B24276B|nr:hypothetical protein [Pectobacterium punjabense]